ncbi:MAG: HAD-IB family phosphatase [Candidatus Saccharimonadales bacterium]
MQEFEGRPYAVFDIDGTLYRWQLFHELVQELTFTGAFPEDTFHLINDRWNKWRGGDLSFHDYEQTVVTILETYLKTISVKDYLTACDKVVSQSKHKTHHYPRALIRTFKKQNYVIIAVSGSQQELLERFGKHYGFDIVVGAIYEHDGTNFTGVMTRPTIGRKGQILDELIATNKLSKEGSLAIGDSDGDADILSKVEQPIAFNPSSGLFNIAKTNGWPIIVERKNIAYRLEKRDRELVLAETIIY